MGQESAARGDGLRRSSRPGGAGRLGCRRPAGRAPWSDVRTPLVHIAAVSEQQTGNTWGPLLEMLRDGPACDEYPGLEPMDSFVALPKGRIEQVTSSARSVKGARAIFAVLDQTEEWVPSNGGPNLAKTMRTNAAKVGGSTVESPNAYRPGDGSVAELSAEYHRAILEGRRQARPVAAVRPPRSSGRHRPRRPRLPRPGAAGGLRRQLGPQGRLPDPPGAVPARPRRPRVDHHADP
jgi:hypothetical protein